jgi:hypothetical protein
MAAPALQSDDATVGPPQAPKETRPTSHQVLSPGEGSRKNGSFEVFIQGPEMSKLQMKVRDLI